MRRIAHLSDIHTLDPQTRRSSTHYRLATRFLSLGRAVDPHGRSKKLVQALAAAKASGAEHFVVTGDLTEMGEAAEFEHLANLLDDARMPADALTLVPGNHDAYTSDSGWRRALSGPLKRWASASATVAGHVVLRGDVAFLPIDTSCFQSLARSGGLFTPEAARAVRARIDDHAFRDKAIVLVMHHPPPSHLKNPLVQWIDGLRGFTHVIAMLAQNPQVQILHGHLHRAVDRIAALGKGVAGATSGSRIFGAPAVVDDAESVPRVRIYDLRGGALESAGLA